MMRAFIAINLPDDERIRLWDALAPLRAHDLPVRWMAPESLHLTIKFLGEVDEGRVPELGNRLNTVAERHPPFVLALGRIGAFPNLQRARVWWVGVHTAPVLGAIQAAVEDSLADVGFPREARPFAPHLTVGRTKGNARAVVDQKIRDTADHIDYAATIPVQEIHLMRSHLGGRVARYERITSAPLRTSATDKERAP